MMSGQSLLLLRICKNSMFKEIKNHVTLCEFFCFLTLIFALLECQTVPFLNIKSFESLTSDSLRFRSL